MVRRFARKARDEHGLLAVLQHRAGDAEYLLLRLARAVDDLGHALAYAAVHVHLGVFADFLKGPHFQLQRGLVRAHTAIRHAAEQLCKLMFVHNLSLLIRQTMNDSSISPNFAAQMPKLS